MCVIITGAASAIRKIEDLEEAYRANPHGWGISWAKRGRIQIRKAGRTGTTFAECLAAIDEAKHANAILHFRWSTSGPEDHTAAHPFELDNGRAAFAHNGVISRWGCKAESDTQELARILNGFRDPAGDAARALLQRLIDDGAGRFAIHAGNGSITMMGRWVELTPASESAPAICASNDYWRSRARTRKAYAATQTQLWTDPADTAEKPPKGATPGTRCKLMPDGSTWRIWVLPDDRKQPTKKGKRLPLLTDWYRMTRKEYYEATLAPSYPFVAEAKRQQEARTARLTEEFTQRPTGTAQTGGSAPALPFDPEKLSENLPAATDSLIPTVSFREPLKLADPKESESSPHWEDWPTDDDFARLTEEDEQAMDEVDRLWRLTAADVGCSEAQLETLMPIEWRLPLTQGQVETLRVNLRKLYPATATTN